MTNRFVISTMCLSASAVKIEGGTGFDFLNGVGNWFKGATGAIEDWAFDVEDWTVNAFDDSIDWVDGAFNDSAEWWYYDAFGNDRYTCEDNTTKHEIHKQIPRKGYTTTFAYHLDMKEESEHIDRDFYSVFGQKNGVNRISALECLAEDCLHSCYNP